MKGNRESHYCSSLVHRRPFVIICKRSTTLTYSVYCRIIKILFLEHLRDLLRTHKVPRDLGVKPLVIKSPSILIKSPSTNRKYLTLLYFTLCYLPLPFMFM